MTIEILLILIISLLFTGAIAGFLSGLLGIGGGIILVPTLYFILNLFQNELNINTENLMHIAIATSLASIIFTGTSSTIAHYKKNSLDINLAKNIGLGAIIGTLFATLVANYLTTENIKFIFANIILILAIIMIINPKNFCINNNKYIKQPYTTITGIIIGFISSLAGIGGATLSVPYMNLHSQITMHRAIGTASAIGVIIAISATSGFIIIGLEKNYLPPFSLGYVNIAALICIIISSIIFAPLGVYTAHNISTTKLKIIFAIFMIIIAINMWKDVIII